MDEQFISWLAGFWDGEGSFGCYYTKTKTGHEVFNPYASICNTNKDILDEIAEKLNATVTKSHISGGNRKPAWRIRMTGKKASDFANILRPHLKMKHPQAEIVRDWTYRNQGGSRGSHYQKDITTMELQRENYSLLRALNKRGF